MQWPFEQLSRNKPFLVAWISSRNTFNCSLCCSKFMPPNWFLVFTCYFVNGFDSFLGISLMLVFDWTIGNWTRSVSRGGLVKQSQNVLPDWLLEPTTCCPMCIASQKSVNWSRRIARINIGSISIPSILSCRIGVKRVHTFVALKMLLTTWNRVQYCLSHRLAFSTTAREKYGNKFDFNGQFKNYNVSIKHDKNMTQCLFAIINEFPHQ